MALCSRLNTWTGLRCVKLLFLFPSPAPKAGTDPYNGNPAQCCRAEIRLQALPGLELTTSAPAQTWLSGSPPMGRFWTTATGCAAAALAVPGASR